jgi:hypothetical protein
LIINDLVESGGSRPAPGIEDPQVTDCKKGKKRNALYKIEIAPLVLHGPNHELFLYEIVVLSRKEYFRDRSAMSR